MTSDRRCSVHRDWGIPSETRFSSGIVFLSYSKKCDNCKRQYLRRGCSSRLKELGNLLRDVDGQIDNAVNMLDGSMSGPSNALEVNQKGVEETSDLVSATSEKRISRNSQSEDHSTSPARHGCALLFKNNTPTLVQGPVSNNKNLQRSTKESQLEHHFETVRKPANLTLADECRGDSTKIHPCCSASWRTWDSNAAHPENSFDRSQNCVWGETSGAGAQSKKQHREAETAACGVISSKVSAQNDAEKEIPESQYKPRTLPKTDVFKCAFGLCVLFGIQYLLWQWFWGSNSYFGFFLNPYHDRLCIPPV